MQTKDRRSPCRALMVLMAGMLLATGSRALAQLPPAEEERLQILNDPEALKKKAEKDKNRPPFEFFRSRVAPLDVIPYVKANHWSTVVFELRANDDDYDGFLQTDPVKMMVGAQQVAYRRGAQLLKEKRASLGLQIMVPSFSAQVPKELLVEMIRPGALRPDANWPATMTTLPTHQMLVLVLSKEATPKFAAWNRMSAIIPSAVDRDGGDIEKLRYYRLVLPMDHDKPALSSHPLTWSTISHTIWDGYIPDDLSLSQQQALLDWIHWGGQLIISGGAGQSFSLLHESFLGPYLPADATAETVPLTQDDLRPLSQSYPPPNSPANPNDQSQPVPATREEALRRFAYRYQAPVPIRPAPTRPLYVAVLKPRPGASTIPLGEASPHHLAIEQRVGRGRITMLTINPNEESLLAWPGLDTLVRRVVLRRPEEPIVAPGDYGRTIPEPLQNGRLLASDLSWYRIMSRDAIGGAATPGNQPVIPEQAEVPLSNVNNNDPEAAENAFNRQVGVAEWRDGAKLPKLSNDLLDQASGITIPSSKFVLRVILAYLIAVIPLNWLICRFVLNRREWTWVVVPLVALAFAVGVERVAARDIGYDTAADEIDLLEIHGDYPRGHLTRLVSLYSNGRSRFAISYPNDPTALALPYDSGLSIRGEEVATSTFLSYPVPTLLDFTVQPRSLAMFRAEQMLTLTGPIRLEEEGGKRRVVNGGELELRDAILIDRTGTTELRERWLGTIAVGAAVEIDGQDGQKPPERVDAGPGPDANPFLAELRTNWETREENQGELRLVAWVAGTTRGQVIEPAVDRHRGFTAVVVHLRSGSTPSPDGRRFNRLAAGDPEVEARVFEQMQMQMQTQGQPARRGQVPAKSFRRPPMPVTRPAPAKSSG
jgi:hypothetical protein